MQQPVYAAEIQLDTEFLVSAQDPGQKTYEVQCLPEFQGTQGMKLHPSGSQDL